MNSCWTMMIMFVVFAEPKKNKGKATPRDSNTEYRCPMPKDVDDAYKLYEDNGNTLWTDAINKKMAALYEMHCFEYHEKGHRPDSYQWTCVYMIVDF